MIKHIVRQNALDKRNAFESDKRKIEQKHIIEQILKDQNYQKAETIALFKAKDSEIDLSSLEHPNAIFCYPKIVDDHMDFLAVDHETEWETSKFGVLEPKHGRIIESIDYMLIPALAVNERKYRIGYGRGYYDTYLAKHRPKKVVAPIFSIQKMNFTEEAHDQMIDEIITYQQQLIIETEVGTFEVIKNHREAFDLQLFLEKYVDVAFDRYTYLVGDLSSEKLRIKGFSQDVKSTNSFKMIPDYLNESCNYNTAYFILRRIKERKADQKDGRNQTTSD